jgi:hypothetical protein
VLIIKVKNHVDVEDIVTDINAEVLCRMEEDDKTIKGWEWIYSAHI